MNPSQIQQMRQMGNLIKGMKNPRQAVLNMLGNNTNPMAQKILKMYQNGDMGNIEQFARNMCKEQGLSYEQELSNIKNVMGL